MDGPDIAAAAALLGDPSRAAMVAALVGGLRLPGSELARRAGVSRSTASEHLARLTDSGLVTAEKCGRHTYYCIAGAPVAEAVESLAVIAPERPPTSLRSSRRQQALGHARLCYDHLAGDVGVAVTEALVDRGLVRPEGSTGLIADCAAWDSAAPLGVSCAALPPGRRPMARACVDWTARRHHLAGALGAAMAQAMLRRGWIQRVRAGERAIRVTEDGVAGLSAHLGIDEARLRAGA